MVVREITLRNFGRLEDATVSLDPGLNCVWGPNEIGKSTLLAGLFMLLFEKPNSTKTATARWRRWGADRMYELGMVFDAEGRHYRLTKDFQAQVSVLRDLDSNQQWEDLGEVQQRLALLIGTESPAIYQATAGLRQQEIMSIQEGRRLGELLQDSISGAADEVSVAQVLAQLDAALGELQRGGAADVSRAPGEMDLAEQTLAQLQTRETELREMLARLQQARRLAESHREEQEQLNAEIAELEKLVAQTQQRRALEQQRELLREQAMELQRRADRARVLNMQIERAEQDRDALPAVTMEQALEAWRLEQAVQQAHEQQAEAEQRLQEAVAERSEIQERAADADTHTPYQKMLTESIALQEEVGRLAAAVEQAKEQAEEAQRTLQGEKERRGLRLASQGMGALFVVVGLITGALSHPAFFVASLLGAGLLFWGFTLRPAASWERLLLHVEETARTLTKAESDHWNTRVKLQNLLGEAQVRSIPELSEKVGEGSEEAVALGRELSQVETRCESHERQREAAGENSQRFQQGLQALLGGAFRDAAHMQEAAQRRERLEHEIRTTREELEGTLPESEAQSEARLRALAGERATLDERLESMQLAGAGLSPESLARVTTELERRQARSKEITQQLAESEALLRSSACDEEDLAAVQEQIGQATERRDRLHRREQVYTITRETLGLARKETLLAATDVLEPAIGELLHRLTLGRYGRVTVNRETLEPVAYSAAKGEGADLDSDLSLATREQLYLAARLSLVSLLWPHEGPPVLLDDPLVNFDDRRRAEAMALLAEYAHDHQVLLFTCSRACLEQADRVIDLTQAESVQS
ncbi:MAG TPA: AAA family ATPase [Armatimonadota bacterium]|jgi:DNA repair exonuclease SbcCD ATPase subunit